MRITEVKLPIRPGDALWVPPKDATAETRRRGEEVSEGVEGAIVDLRHGDSLELLKSLPDCSVDSCVTDPPYGIRFMGKAWDGADIEAQVQKRASQKQPLHRNGIERVNPRKTAAESAGTYDVSIRGNLAFQKWTRLWAVEVFRVLKPGAHLVSFSSTRTYHRMTSGIEDAGFEIRDQLAWVFGSGFPKSHNLHGDWEGWGTALKPAWEPICLARKPLVGTVEQNVLRHGTGALNVDGCRIGNDGEEDFESGKQESRKIPGRWPANLAHDGSEEVVALFPDQTSGAMKAQTRRAAQDGPGSVCYGKYGGNITAMDIESSSGSAARFFYCPKASRADRNDGLDGQPTKPLNWSSGEQSPGTFQSQNTNREAANHHPTVKPTELMRWLVRLITRPRGVVLDLFMGSGSTGRAAVLEGFDFIGIDQDAEYVEIARARIAAAQRLRAEELASAAAQPELFSETPAETQRREEEVGPLGEPSLPEMEGVR